MRSPEDHLASHLSAAASRQAFIDIDGIQLSIRWQVMTDRGADVPLMSVEGLHVTFRGDRGGTVRAVNGLSLALRRGRTLGIAGKSGSGKSVTALSIMSLPPNRCPNLQGRSRLEQRNLQALPGAGDTPPSSDVLLGDAGLIKAASTKVHN